MHKKIKHIIAVSLVVGAISCVLPSNNFIFGSVEAHAAAYNDAGNGELSSLIITRGIGNEIELRDSYSGNQISLTGKKDYYIELKGGDGIEISANVKGNGYVVKQFVSADKTEEGQNVGEYIDVDSTYETVYLRTYKSEDAYKDAYNNDDVSKCEKTYVIHVRKPAATDSEEEEDKDYAYLRSIYLSNGNIDFSKKQLSYDLNVNEDVDEITVRVKPEEDDALVEINGSSVEEDTDYEKTISLDKGNNTIEIYVENNEDDETYTLNVYRGKSTSTTQTSTSNSLGVQNFAIQNQIGKNNTWQRVDGKWKYIDGTGEALKNKWWFDKNTGKNYYLKEDGYVAVGWLYNNNNWYYLNENGEMQVGWICLDKNWYYLNNSGVMQMGWLEDSTGNWYYLDSSGAMKTGWIEGSDQKWYYLNSEGKMVKNPVINR